VEYLISRGGLKGIKQGAPANAYTHTHGRHFSDNEEMMVGDIHQSGTAT